MARRIATGIDIGTRQTKVVIVEEVRTPDGRQLKIIGTGLSESDGLRHGYVVDLEDAAKAVMSAKLQAEKSAGVEVKGAFLAVGGVSLDETRSSGETIIVRPDQLITEHDLEKASSMARESASPNFVNREVLHEIPLSFRVDGQKVLGDPIGMKGTKLEVEYLFVTCLAQHASLLTNVVEAAEVEVIDRMASPLAGSYVTLTRDQKMKGCVLANIGAETVSIVVYDEGVPISLKVFPIGSTNITDDLALGFKISLEDAERIKLGRLGGAMYSRKRIEEIITARFKHMFDLIDKHLRAIGRRGNLPAGIILSGGGSGQGSIADIAKGSLALPSRIADLKLSSDTKIRDATWSVAYGLALWGLTGETETTKKSPFSGFSESIATFLKQFMP
ncbi:MAG: cell division protein FtsA [Candidatus Pacebacteria bacterium]|nr:cell division protein FtsA [Candidatus Paceibacterota bacterium]